MQREHQDKMNLYSQYRQAYGELAEAGKFRVGENVLFDDGADLGEIIWKYINPQGILTYVLDDSSGFPVEVAATEVMEP
ncbi:hypothetical protein [Ktedonospora formicarum]|uniref:Uncharacterized protein n=1 Tax=Ktedonospora formicarum TaxID=2778364 RepID=A0A8J3MXK2_9CHLR|nr:hypothetical protein [Ktedonospora formicarum]GHO51505.1 hypothetical protein KSX_96680 [Ktedonospora formicarum]